MKRFMRRWLHKKGWYKINELAIGGHCGLCGAWIGDEIFPEEWRVGICIACYTDSENDLFVKYPSLAIESKEE